VYIIFDCFLVVVVFMGCYVVAHNYHMFFDLLI